jgi:biopolymer transport protein ExbD
MLRFLLSMRRVLLLSVGALLVAAAQTPAFRKGVSVQMPVTTNADPAPDADRADSLVVAVTFRGTVFLGATTVTPAQLSEQVKARLNAHPDNRTYLKADARTPCSTVAEVLDALRTAGVNAPILLTARLDDSTDGTYVSPKGLEVLLAPAPDAAQSDKAAVLQVGGETRFGDVVHAVDMYRAAKIRVFLSTPGK